jgi:hypothetical protein
MLVFTSVFMNTFLAYVPTVSFCNLPVCVSPLITCRQQEEESASQCRCSWLSRAADLLFLSLWWRMKTVRVRVTLWLVVYCQSVCLGDKPLKTHNWQFFFQLNTCFNSPYVTSSLMRGWICPFQLLLALARTVVLRSESHGTHDHILLSQIQDSLNLEGQVPVYIPQEQGGPVMPPGIGFPFRHLLWLAGLWWRYLTLPPHRILNAVCVECLHKTSSHTQEKTQSVTPVDFCSLPDMYVF